MVGAVAGAAAMLGVAAAGAELLRRRLAIRARIARRLSPKIEPVAERLSRIHQMPVLPTMAKKADAA